MEATTMCLDSSRSWRLGYDSGDYEWQPYDASCLVNATTARNLSTGLALKGRRGKRLRCLLCLALSTQEGRSVSLIAKGELTVVKLWWPATRAAVLR